MLLYDSIDKKAYVFITSSHLPVNGWFQHCLVCDIVTAQTQLFKINNDTYFYYYRCSPCKKKEIKNEYSKDMYSWLKKQCKKYKYKYINY